MDPNICIVVLDAVRAQNLSCYGHTRETTPNIDAIVDEEIIFDNAVSPAAVTLDSTASLFTGLYPSDHRTGQKGEIVTDVPHLPEVLHEAGYTTRAITTNPFITPGFGFERGIDQFTAKEHRFKDGMNIRRFFDRNKNRPAYQIYLQFLFEAFDHNFISNVGNALQFRFDLFTREDNGANETTTEATKFIRKRSHPWFMYLHYSEPHMKNIEHLYRLPEEYKYHFVDRQEVDQTPIKRNPDEEYNKVEMDVHERLYDGTIRYLDKHIRHIIEVLKSTNQWEETLFILTADHGECLGEHGAVGHGYLYEEGINVPLLIKPPVGMTEDLGRRSERVSTLGLYKTITDLVNNVPQLEHIRVPSVFEQKNSVLVQDYSGSWTWSSYKNEIAGKHALYDRELKLIRRGETQELYDLSVDPNESKNVINEHPKREELQNILENYLEEFNDTDGSIDQIELSEDASQQLEDLGYL